MATSVTVLSGGNWTATYKDGATWYVSGSVSATGAVTLSNIGTLTISKGAVVSGATLTGGIPTVSVLNGGTMVSSYEMNGYLRVASGGLVTGNTLNSTEVTLSSGGSSVDDLFVNSGSGADTDAYVYVSSGASLLGATMSDGAVAGLALSAFSGATVSGLTLGSGASAYLSSGATASDINTGAGSVLSMATSYGSGSSYVYVPPRSAVVLSGGTWSAVSINKVTYYVSGSVSATGAVTFSAISTLTISSGATVSGATISGSVATVSVMSGGLLENSLVLNGYVSAMGGATLSSNVLNSDVVYLSYGAKSIGDTYINSGVGADGYSDAYIYSGATLTSPYIGAANAGSFVVRVSSGASITDPTLIRNGGQLLAYGGTVSSTDPTPCYLAGTFIKTPEGMTAVEEIQIGDKVLARVGDVTEERKIIWAGKASAMIRSDLESDLSGYPVRILKGALGEDLPNKDMLITSEHCLFLDDAFVPIRMLVNGSSIYYDRTFNEYEYYHIETEHHSVIMADGIWSESYLDTGKRQSFRQTGGVHVLGARTLDWHVAAAAPLRTDRAFVEPIFERLAAQAGFNGVPTHDVAQLETTSEPDIHIVTEAGEWIGRCRSRNDQYVFVLPPNARDVRIVSNTSRPSDVIGPYVDDRRRLGVLVGAIMLFDSWQSVDLPDALNNAGQHGWNNLEPCGRRWTNGNAALSLPERRPGGVTLLALRIDAAGPYLKPRFPAETAHYESSIVGESVQALRRA
ncbi:Hint domain-containing protein [Asaia sp. HN010]|uniref:Hint domain-containing protein n=1 Tax=Asaia sp. HN010 TaxID=3081233 RepID=UPI003017FA0B